MRPAKTPLPVSTASTSKRPAPTLSLNVLVTGAAGRTGRLVLSTLLSQPDKFTARGLVRSISRAESAADHPLPADALIEGDVTQRDTLLSPMASIDTLVILTSACPKMNPPVEGQPPTFYYEEEGMPELVDWIGAKNQIDVAKEAGVNHIVIVGSMGSTDDANPLNRLGNGNILRFKRKAELYLIDSGVPYTVVNPAGLINEPASQRQLVFGSADELFTVFTRKDMSIPRADVARVVVAALTDPVAKNKAFDVCGRPVGVGDVTTEFAPMFARAGPEL